MNAFVWYFEAQKRNTEGRSKIHLFTNGTKVTYKIVKKTTTKGRLKTEERGVVQRGYKRYVQEGVSGSNSKRERSDK
jgi:hypothetical protein